MSLPPSSSIITRSLSLPGEAVFREMRSLIVSEVLFFPLSSCCAPPYTHTMLAVSALPAVSFPLRRGPAASCTVSPPLLPRTNSSVRCAALMANGSSSNGIYTVGDFMTGREDLHVVKPTTTVDRALEMLVENRITGFPVIDDNWKLVGVVSDYDLLALDSISGSRQSDASMFPEADSSWKTFNEIQKLLNKTNGRVVADVMTSVPLVVRETTNLEDAARLLLETKYRRLPVVDGMGKLVGIITRGNVVRAALHIKHENEKRTQV